MEFAPRPLTPAEFSGIQAVIGLDDAAMGAKLFRVQNGEDIVRRLRSGTHPISMEVTAAMLQYEEDACGREAAVMLVARPSARSA